jgi:O-antigen ligase
MALVIVILSVAFLTLAAIALVGGLEQALPFAAFACLLIPARCKIPIPGLFDLTGQRLILVTLLVFFILRTSPDSKASPVQRVPLVLLMVAQVVWSLISTANSIVPVMSLKKLLGEVFEYYCLYIIYVKTISSVQTIYRILYAIVSAIFVCAVFGAVEAYTGWKVLSLFPIGEGRIAEALGVSFGQGGGISSTFPHRILFGAALAIGITLALHLLKVAESRRKRIFLRVAILLMFLNIYKTVSRGPWLGLILAFILLFVFEPGKMRKYHMVIAALSLAVLIIRPGVLMSIRSLYGATFDVNWSNPKGMSTGYRFELRRITQAALARDFRRQLWGYGMESFVDLNLEGELAGHRMPFLSCDSAWIELMVETGYVGLFLIACLLFAPAYLAWRDFRRLPDPDRYLSLNLFVNMTIYYFMMLGVAMYAWGQEGYMLWILIATSIVYGKLKESEQRKGRAVTAAVSVHAAAG